LRIYAPFMTAGAVVFAVAAVFLLAQSGSGASVFAEGPAGTAVTIPDTATKPLIIYAITRPGGAPLDLECEMGATSKARMGIHFGMSARDNGRTLEPVRTITSTWRAGDTFTCTGTGFEAVAIGHNDGLTRLLQGLLAAFVAVGGGLMGALGFAIRRRWPSP
jgi:hypothetical protein